MISTPKSAARNALAGLMLYALTMLPVGASIIDPVTPQQLSKDAELVFEGEVISVDYRMSEPGNGAPSLPHTFVTYRIDRLLKGASQDGNIIVLRMQGGPMQGGHMAMMVAGMPTFDVGDRDLLFVRGNGQAIAPLVGWDQGRFRVVNGLVYSDDGHEIFLDPQNRFIRGQARPLPEVLTHRMGKVEIGFAAPSSAAPFSPPSGARRATESEFVRAVQGLITTTNRPEALKAAAPQASAKPGLPFRIAASAPLPAPKRPAVAPAVTLRGEPDLIEQRLVEEKLRRTLKAPQGPKQPKRP